MTPAELRRANRSARAKYEREDRAAARTAELAECCCGSTADGHCSHLADYRPPRGLFGRIRRIVLRANPGHGRRGHKHGPVRSSSRARARRSRRRR